MMQPSPEASERFALLKRLAASQLYYDSITKHTDPDQDSGYPEDMRRELVTQLSSQWLTDHARQLFPKIDEFEIDKDWVVQHPDHDQNDEHSRFSLRQLGAYLDTQKHHLNIKF